MDGNKILYQGVSCLPAKDMPSFEMAHHDLFGHIKAGPLMDTLVKDWRWPRWAFPLRIKESDKAVSFLWKLVCDYACVRLIQHDRGDEVLRNAVKLFCRHFALDQRPNSSHHPQT